MHANSHSVLMLADLRHHELQNEVAPLCLIRAASRGTPTRHAAVATARRRLGATLARVRSHLRIVRWPLTFSRHGAFPH
jgi:hypothetical protein